MRTKTYILENLVNAKKYKCVQHEKELIIELITTKIQNMGPLSFLTVL